MEELHLIPAMLLMVGSLTVQPLEDSVLCQLMDTKTPPECDNGSYRYNCLENCGACLGYKQCHHINGSCLEGCDAGYEGELCTTGCSSGKFGINCEEVCNKKCAVPNKCNGTTGECEGGCQPGWEGLQCKQGFYGDECKKECSLFCKSSRDCNHVTGYCNEGCIGGWQGLKCLEALCVSFTVISILVAYMCINRRRIKERHAKQKYKENNSIKAGGLDLYNISTESNSDNKYQELGELSLPSDYEGLR
ncbi:multiple epidermal growth factor-like domains protein 11 [Saccostrea echinata]|uniref:multiple epidermal growth factor-like domains protein 11 n=1 Tax=Saccostrea echinata TaxID=191078 RepID=UPI002A8005FD|nr:multiple epidermal growth factor-like domains protein 11 [Saccostrea echinata]